MGKRGGGERYQEKYKLLNKGRRSLLVTRPIPAPQSRAREQPAPSSPWWRKCANIKFITIYWKYFTEYINVICF